MGSGNGGFQSSDINLAPSATQGVIGVAPTGNGNVNAVTTTGGTPAWQSDLAKALQGAGKGLQQSSQMGGPARGMGGGWQSPVSQPQLQNNFDPNYLLQFLKGQNGNTNSSLLFGGQ